MNATEKIKLTKNVTLGYNFGTPVIDIATIIIEDNKIHVDHAGSRRFIKSLNTWLNDGTYSIDTVLKVLNQHNWNLVK